MMKYFNTAAGWVLLALLNAIFNVLCLPIYIVVMALYLFGIIGQPTQEPSMKTTRNSQRTTQEPILRKAKISPGAWKKSPEDIRRYERMLPKETADKNGLARGLRTPVFTKKPGKLESTDRVSVKHSRHCMIDISGDCTCRPTIKIIRRYRDL